MDSMTHWYSTWFVSVFHTFVLCGSPARVAEVTSLLSPLEGTRWLLTP